MYRKNTLHMEEKEKRKLPLLHNDENWLNIFGDIEDEKIEGLKKQMQQLLLTQEEARRQHAAIVSHKKNAIQKIIQLSDNINNNHKFSDVDLLDLEKKRLEQLSYELDNVQYQLESIPKKIRENNFRLLEATIEYSYAELNRREEELAMINQEMLDVRSRLKYLFEQRLAHEEWNEKTYVYLHSTLGAKMIEKIDDEKRKNTDE